jgi:hypothetical protein
VPDSFGKRNREKVKARKAEARDDRRIARNQRRKGILPAISSESDEVNESSDPEDVDSRDEPTSESG